MTLRLEESPAKLPANEAAGTAPIPGAPQVTGRLRISVRICHLAQASTASLYLPVRRNVSVSQTEEIEIVGICFQPQANFLDRCIELARALVKPGESVRPRERINFHRLLPRLDSFCITVDCLEQTGPQVIQLAVLRIEADGTENLPVGVSPSHRSMRNMAAIAWCACGRFGSSSSARWAACSSGTCWYEGREHGGDTLAVIVGKSRPGQRIIGLEIYRLSDQAPDSSMWSPNQR